MGGLFSFWELIVLFFALISHTVSIYLPNFSLVSFILCIFAAKFKIMMNWSLFSMYIALALLGLGMVVYAKLEDRNKKQ